MAARLNKRHTEEVRQKIQASVLIDRLHKVASGELEVTQQQLKATEILLDRSVAKLQAIQVSGDSENPLTFTEIVRKVVK